MSVYKAHDLIDASYRLNVQSQKLVLACLGKIDSRPETQPQKEVKLTATEFSELMGIDIKNAHRELYKAADSLFKSSIILHEGDEEIELYWIQEKAKKLKGEGAVTIIWSDRILRYISQLKGRFTKFKLRNIASLQSGHSIRLYELLMRFNSTGIRNIALLDFRSALGLDDKYTEFKILNRDVIKPAVNELNQRSDLIISYETLKSGRSVVGLSFSFKQNQQMKMDI
ncbi:replication initiation protein [Shewanella algae]|uniref:replication initiation protein n=1 Tax=Shewanella algae TaxID=38313 RepID=UPI001FBC12C2|nr:replication initiation protein [Shewanella algae]